MDRKLPSFNNYLTKKWHEKTMELHRRRIKEIRPRIENCNYNSTKYLSHLENHSKKRYNQYIHCSSIDNENTRLLSLCAGANYKGITPVPSQKPNYIKPSLNFDYRKKTLFKLENENKSIIKRLENLGPLLPRKKYI